MELYAGDSRLEDLIPTLRLDELSYESKAFY